MMQKRVLAVYFSIMRRRAICAVEVMASASSRMMSLKEAIEEGEVVVGVMEKICLVPGWRVQTFRVFIEGGCRRTCKRLDLLAYHIDTSIVAGVELEDHLAHILGAIDSSG